MKRSRRVKGCCPLDCPDTCAWVAHVEDGRVVRVEGAVQHPITRGVLCAKVRDYPKRTYAPDRLLHPLMRCGPKGSGEFRRLGEARSHGEVMRALAQRMGLDAPALRESDEEIAASSLPDPPRAATAGMPRARVPRARRPATSPAE